MRYLISLIILQLLWGCGGKKESQGKSPATIGTIERLEPGIDQVLPEDAEIEILADGFEWIEGPLWIPEGYLIFSEIPLNKVYKWSEEKGVSEYLEPSGYTGATKRGGELGSNGLLLNKNGQLILCQHGDRRIARMNSTLDQPKSDFVSLVDVYEGMKLNSPNDAVFHSDGSIFFTDPPYGLEQGMEDYSKEISFQGVYRFSPEEGVKLVTDSLSRPNGIALSPDESRLYVANSDPKRAIWAAYDLDVDGNIVGGELFFDATSRVGESKGLPDGLKVHSSGHLFATGPGGVLVFNSSGQHLGTINTGVATSNCAFDTQESYLYITADMYLLRVKLK